MGVEIERKFLIDHEKWNNLDKPEGVHYQQGYILSDDHHTVRIRVAGTHSYITLKASTGNHVSRKEYEYEIPLAEGEEILQEFAKNGTEKIRYRIPLGGFIWEIDEFLGDNKGLIVAEIELKNEQDEFEKPDWVKNEVTDDVRYTNSNLAIHPFKNWG